MLNLPIPIPPGTSYVRIPRSKSAAMRLILEITQRGSRYWTGGTISTQKAMRLSEKFAQRYGTDARAGKREWDKAHGRANVTLIMYPEDDQALTPLRWWLLATPGSGAVHQEEQLKDTWDKHQRLTWGDQYELVHLQRERRYGGGRRWTWRLTEARYAELAAAMRQLANRPGTPAERTDDLARLIEAIRHMPGFHGVRMQQMHLYAIGKACWARTHCGEYNGWPTKTPYLDKREPVYHRPHHLTLDVLVRVYERRVAAVAAL